MRYLQTTELKTREYEKHHYKIKHNNTIIKLLKSIIRYIQIVINSLKNTKLMN